MRAAVNEIDPGLVAMACGSFRRGKATCGDVDVLITHPDGKSHRGVFHLILNKLKQTGEYLASSAQCPLYLHLAHTVVTKAALTEEEPLMSSPAI